MARIKTRTAKDGTARYTGEVRLKGYPPQSATFKRLTDAKKWIQDTESAIREGRHFKTVESKKHTFAEMIDRFIEAVNFTQDQASHQGMHLKRWRDELGHLLLSDVTASTITEVKDKLLSEVTQKGLNRSPSTVNRYLDSLSPVFTLAVNEWQWLEDSPIKKVKSLKEPEGRVRFLSDDERARLLDACQQSKSKPLYLCVVMAISTGMRKTELMSLKWRDVDLKTGSIILHKTKNGEKRRVYLSGYGLDLLNEYAKIRRLDSQLLFPGDDVKKPVDLRTPWETALKRAEITDFRWHDLRHTTASYLAMGGASLSEIAEITGHKSMQMVQRYSHLSDTHVQGVVSAMNEKIFGGE